MNTSNNTSQTSHSDMKWLKSLPIQERREKLILNDIDPDKWEEERRMDLLRDVQLAVTQAENPQKVALDLVNVAIGQLDKPDRQAVLDSLAGSTTSE